jgi:Lon protease-like protein
MSDEFPDPGNSEGVARLFPLPNLVIYPQVLQPLHIFEPRYRQMTADALDDDRRIALVLLRDGWEDDYAGRPPIHSTACLARIVAEQRMDDGRFNILLRGLSRIRIVEELATDKLYRSARCEVIPESEELTPVASRKLRRQLARQVPTWFGKVGPTSIQVRKLLKSDTPLGVLCDIVAFALPLDMALKQELLEIGDVEQRTRLLVRHMKANQPPAGAAAGKKKFPPDFSEN